MVGGGRGASILNLDCGVVRERERERNDVASHVKNDPTFEREIVQVDFDDYYGVG